VVLAQAGMKWNAQKGKLQLHAGPDDLNPNKGGWGGGQSGDEYKLGDAYHARAAEYLGYGSRKAPNPAGEYAIPQFQEERSAECKSICPPCEA